MALRSGSARRLVASILLGALVFVVSGVASAGASRLTFRLAHPLAVTHPRHLASERFAELVRQRTDGRVEITIYPAGQLGDEIELGEAVQIGAVDFAVIGGPIFTNWVPQYAVFGLPFLFGSYEEAYAALDGPLGDRMKQLAEAKGFVLLSHWDHGFRHITNRVRPIEKPEDLRGLKMRVPQEFVNIETFKALGSSVVAIPFGELYLALQQGVVDGQENPLGNIYYSKLYEVQRYLSMTSHIYANSILITSTTTWRRIPADVRQVMLEAAEEAKVYMRQLIKEDDARLLKELEAEGMIISYPDLAPFREASKSVYTALQDRIGRDIIEEALKLVEK